MPTANLAEARSHNVEPEAFLKHHRDITVAKREHAEAGTAVARLKKAAKSGSVDLDAYQLLEKLRKREPDEQAIILRHVIQYATILEMPIGTQFSMMDAPKMPPVKPKARAEHELWKAGEAGLKAGRDGHALDANPYPAGSEHHVAFAKRYQEGLAERATAAGMESTERERPSGKAPAAAKAKNGRGRSGGRAAQVEQHMSNAREHLNGGMPAH
jgi:hypothetical protein